MIQHVSDIDIVILTFAIVAYLGTARFITYQRLDIEFDTAKRKKKQEFLSKIAIPDITYCILGVLFLFDFFFNWAVSNKSVFIDYAPRYFKEVASIYMSVRNLLLPLMYLVFFVTSFWLMLIHVSYIWRKRDDDLKDKEEGP